MNQEGKKNPTNQHRLLPPSASAGTSHRPRAYLRGQQGFGRQNRLLQPHALAWGEPGVTGENRGPRDPETRPCSHRCTPTPRPHVCAPRLAQGSPSRPRHDSKKSPRVASAAGPPNPSSSRITSQRSRLCAPSGLQRPRGQPQPPPKRRSAPEDRAGKGGGVERDLDAEPPDAGSGDTWSLARLLLSVSKQII